MKLKFHGRSVELIRERGERALRNESDMWYRLRNALRARGFDVIKKLMAKDGHLTNDDRHYVRTRNVRGPKSFWIYHNHYAIRDAYPDFNKEGRVTLSVDRHLDKDD